MKPNEQSMAMLNTTAMQLLTKQAGKPFKNVKHTSEETGADGEKVYLYIAHPAADPNGKSYQVALTASGKEVSAAELQKNKMFAPEPMEIKKELLDAIMAGPDAITISPTTNDLTLKECDTFDEVITVHVPKNPQKQVDVYILADTTGSMGGVLSAVQAGASTIIGTSYGPGVDIAYGVGNYKDFQSGDPYCFQNQLDPAAYTPAAATAAIGAWSASGGGDEPEGQLFALDQLATPSGAVIPVAWRSGSIKIIVWFGDASGHEPICPPISGVPYTIDRTSVGAKMVAEGIAVLAISVGANNLDGPPTTGYAGCPTSGLPGQATYITAVSGGSYTSGISTPAIVATIISLINAAVSVIGNLTLVPTGATAPFVTSINPAGGYGPLSGDTEYDLPFDVHFTGVMPCDNVDRDYYGTIDAVADGVVVASKKVHIRVPACCKKRRYSYNVKFVIGRKEKNECNTQTMVNPGLYTTEINILNYDETRKANIKKYVIPLVFSEEPIGREPNYGKIQGADGITLPPFTATMDDNYKITELLFGGKVPCNIGITIGYFVIVSDIKLTVTAVYTGATLDGQLATMDVEDICPTEIPIGSDATGGGGIPGGDTPDTPGTATPSPVKPGIKASGKA